MRNPSRRDADRIDRDHGGSGLLGQAPIGKSSEQRAPRVEKLPIWVKLARSGTRSDKVAARWFQMIDFSALSKAPGISKRLRAFFATTFAFCLSLIGCTEPGVKPPDFGMAAPTPILRVATSGDYAPFSLTETGDPAMSSGFSIDLARAFAESEHAEIRWIGFRWPRLLADLEAERFDLAISGITVRPERSVAGRFSLPVTRSGLVVLVAEGGPVHDAEDLDRPGMRLAVNAGGHLERAARKLFSRATIIAVPRNQDVPARGRRGEVDGIVSDSIEAPHWLPRWPGSHAIGPLTRDRKAALFAPTRDALARRFDVWLLESEASGELARLRARHGLPAARTATAGSALLASLDERLALMRGVALAKATLGLSIEDRAREEQVLEAAWRSVEEAAREAGHAAPRREAVRALFQAQIEAAKWIQRQVIADENAAISTGRGATREEARWELDQALRPALIRIGDRIARLVARGATDDSSTFPSETQVAEALEGHQLPEAHLRAIREALTELSRPAARAASTLPPRAEARGRAPSA